MASYDVIETHTMIEYIKPFSESSRSMSYFLFEKYVSFLDQVTTDEDNVGFDAKFDYNEFDNLPYKMMSKEEFTDQCNDMFETFPKLMNETTKDILNNPEIYGIIRKTSNDESEYSKYNYLYISENELSKIKLDNDEIKDYIKIGEHNIPLSEDTSKTVSEQGLMMSNFPVLASKFVKNLDISFQIEKNFIRKMASFEYISDDDLNKLKTIRDYDMFEGGYVTSIFLNKDARVKTDSNQFGVIEQVVQDNLGSKQYSIKLDGSQEKKHSMIHNYLY